MRHLWLAVAVGMTAGSLDDEMATAATPGAGVSPPESPPRLRQSRRRVERGGPQFLEPQLSPDGRHVIAVSAGTVLLNGRRVHPSRGQVELLVAPVWRADGGAVAWIERDATEVRLVVLPELSGRAEAMSWALPVPLARDQITWAGRHRVVVGPEPLAPRAVASWTE